MTKEKKDNKLFKTLIIIKNIIFAVILVFLVAVITLSLVTRISGKTPSIMGYTVYRVSSGSMVPTLKVGDIILCQSCDPLKLKNGDIITYDGTIGEFKGKSVTHRVIKEPYKQGKDYFLVTKGDDNPNADTPIRISQVTGLYQSKIEYLKLLYDFFITPWGLLTLIALIILAFFNEIIIFIKAFFGIGYTEEKESLDDIIARYRNESESTQNNEKTIFEPDVKTKVTRKAEDNIDDTE